MRRPAAALIICCHIGSGCPDVVEPDGAPPSDFIRARARVQTPPVLDPIRLSPAANAPAANLLPDGGRALLAVNVTLVDSDSSSMVSRQDVARAIANAHADAIVVCFTVDEPQALVRVVSHWLAGVREAGAARPHWPYTPVCLVGTKEDMFDAGDAVVWASTYRQIIECVRAMEAEGTAAPAAVPDELAAGLSAEDARRACLEAILLSFSFVFGTMHVSVREPADPSGGVLAEVGELLQQVASMVVFPSFPLYLALESEPTSDFGQAMARMFRILDGDRDGLLSRDEFSLFQLHVNSVRLGENEMAAFFNQLAEECPDGVTDDRQALTQFGFEYMFESFVRKGMPELVWDALDAFGYAWGQPSTHMSATAAGAAAVEVSAEFKLFLRPCDKYGFAHDTPSYPDASFALSLPAAALSAIQAREPPPSVAVLRAPGARSTGAGFLTGLFAQFSVGGGAQILDQEGLARMFEVVPSRSHPFGPLYPFTCVHNVHGAVSHASWLSLWDALLATEPTTALRALYELGYACVGPASTRQRSNLGAGGTSSNGVNDSCDSLSLCCDPRGPRGWIPPIGLPVTGAVREDCRRKTYAFAPATTRRVFVVGSPRAGKTAFIQHAIGGSAQMQTFMAHAAAEAVEASFSGHSHSSAAAAVAGTTASGGVAATAQRHAPAHYVVAVPPFNFKEEAEEGGGVQRARHTPKSTLDAAAASPSHLTITEWPASCTSTALDEAARQADALIFVVDPTSTSSIAFFRKWVEEVPDRTPTMVVVALHEERGETPNRMGNAFMSTLCGSGDDPAPLPPLPADAAGAANVHAATSEVDREARESGDDAATAPSTVVGLSLPVFRFWLKARDDVSREIIKFAALRCVVPGADNPRNAERRRSQWWQAVSSVALRTCMFSASILVATMWADKRFDAAGLMRAALSSSSSGRGGGRG